MKNNISDEQEIQIKQCVVQPNVFKIMLIVFVSVWFTTVLLYILVLYPLNFVIIWKEIILSSTLLLFLNTPFTFDLSIVIICCFISVKLSILIHNLSLIDGYLYVLLYSYHLLFIVLFHVLFMY